MDGSIFDPGPMTLACPNVAWIVLIDRFGDDTYALRRGGEVSLVDTGTLKSLLNQLLGVHREMGGDDVAGA